MWTRLSESVLGKRLLVSFLFLLLVLPLFYLIGISRQSNIDLIGHFLHEEPGPKLRTKNVVKSPDLLYHFNGKNSEAYNKGIKELSNEVFSLSFWVKFERLEKSMSLLFLKGKRKFFYISTGTKRRSKTGIQINLTDHKGKWRPAYASDKKFFDSHILYHVVVTVNTITGNIYLFLNNELIAQQRILQGKIPRNPSTLWLGSFPKNQRTLNGWLYDVKIFNGQLSEEQVDRLFNQKPVASSNAMLYSITLLFALLFLLFSHKIIDPFFKRFKEKVMNALLVSSFLAIALFLYTPSYIFFTNALEFNFSFTEFIFGLLNLALIFIIYLTVLFTFLRYEVFKPVIAIVFSLAFLIWVQSNFLVWDYGPLDGRQIDWGEKVALGILDTSLWTVLLIFALVRASTVYGLTTKVIPMMGVIMALSLSFTFYQNKQYIDSQSFKYKINYISLFNYSKQKNIILIVLDAFQSDVFYELVEEHPHFKKSFDGFTYHPNATSGFSHTLCSIPNILTGVYYDNSKPYQQYIKDSYLDNSLPKVLKDNGYQVELFPKYSERTIFKDKRVMSNVRKKGRRASLIHSLKLFDLALFRALPHFLKRYVHNESQWLIRRIPITIEKEDKDDDFLGSFPKSRNQGSIDKDAGFFEELNTRIRVDEPSPVFKFYHLKGGHHPFNVNEYGMPVKHKRTRLTYKGQVHYKVKLVTGFFETLKSKDLYDNTMIIVVSDHGVGGGDIYVRSEMLKEVSSNIPQKILPEVKARAAPLVLFKPFKNRGELKLSLAPMALSQIPEMIFNQLNLDITKKEDTSEYGLARRYLWNTGRDKNSILYEYHINGFSWLDESWENPRNIYTTKGKFVLTNDISFDPTGNFSNYLITDRPNPQYLFKPGTKFSLQIPVNKRADLLLKVLTDSLFRPRKNELIIRNSKYLQIDFETHDFDQTSNKIHIYCNGDKAFEIKIRKNERLNVIKLYAKKTL